MKPIHRLEVFSMEANTFLRELEMSASRRREEIRARADTLKISGSTYYVSNAGDDANDGRSPASAWKTLSRVSEAERSY